MKLGGYNFWAKTHIKGARKSTSVFVLLLFTVIALTLILSFAFTMNNVIYNYKNQDPVRRISIDSAFIDLGYIPISDTVLSEIAQLEHVQSVDKMEGMQYQFFNVQAVTDEKEKDCSSMLPVSLENSTLEVWSLYKSQKMDVIAGNNLEESPVFSCLLPNNFYIGNKDVYEEECDFQDGTQYIGKTFTVKSVMDSYEMTYYAKDDYGGYITNWWNLPALEYKLKVVGVYNASLDNGGGPNTVYVSNETAVKIEKMAVMATEDLDFIAEYESRKKDPVLHEYTILVDEYDHIDRVMQQLEERKIAFSSTTKSIIPESVLLLSAIFTGAGNFMTFAVLLLTIVNLFISASNNLIDRKGEIGLLKAVGYKNRQVFFCLYLEHLQIGLRAFCTGVLISGAVVLAVNLLNGNGPFQNRIYVVQWQDFLLLSAVSLGIAILVPLLCQLVMLPRLTKIEPRQAMQGL